MENIFAVLYYVSTTLGSLLVLFIFLVCTKEWFMTTFFGTKIEVTYGDIIDGRSWNSNCPIALAIKRIYKIKHPNISDFSVEVEDKGNIYLYYGKKTRILKHNPKQSKIADFVKKFDKGQEVKPFNFKLWI